MGYAIGNAMYHLSHEATHSGNPNDGGTAASGFGGADLW
jgi:hypothetical protein